MSGLPAAAADERSSLLHAWSVDAQIRGNEALELREPSDRLRLRPAYYGPFYFSFKSYLISVFTKSKKEKNHQSRLLISTSFLCLYCLQPYISKQSTTSLQTNKIPKIDFTFRTESTLPCFQYFQHSSGRLIFFINFADFINFILNFKIIQFFWSF